MRFSIFVITLTMIISLSLSAFAKTIPYNHAKVEIWIPDHWVISQEEQNSPPQSLELNPSVDGPKNVGLSEIAKEMKEEREILAYEKNDEAMMVFSVIDAQTLNHAKENLDLLLSSVFPSFELKDKIKEIKINGMAAFTLNGVTKIQGKAVDAQITVIQTTVAQKVLMAVGLTEAQNRSKYQTIFSQMVQQIRPL